MKELSLIEGKQFQAFLLASEASMFYKLHKTITFIDKPYWALLLNTLFTMKYGSIIIDTFGSFASEYEALNEPKHLEIVSFVLLQSCLNI